MRQLMALSFEDVERGKGARIMLAFVIPAKGAGRSRPPKPASAQNPPRKASGPSRATKTVAKRKRPGVMVDSDDGFIEISDDEEEVFAPTSGEQMPRNFEGSDSVLSDDEEEEDVPWSHNLRAPPSLWQKSPRAAKKSRITDHEKDDVICLDD